MQDGILGGRDLQLGKHGDVGGDARDGKVGGAVDVARAVELGRRVHLVGAEVGEADGLDNLGRTVAVAVEDVDAEDVLFSQDGEGAEGGGGGRSEQEL